MYRRAFFFLTLSTLFSHSAGFATTQPSFSNLPKVNYEANEISKICDTAIQTAKDKYNRLAAISKEKQTFENTVWEMDRIAAEFGDTIAPIVFIRDVTISRSVRDAAQECSIKAIQFQNVEVFSRLDLFQALKSYSNSRPKLDSQGKRLLTELLKQFKRSGLMLSAEKHAELERLKKHLVKLEYQFIKNVSEYDEYVSFSREEMDGLPKSYFKERGRMLDGNYKVALTFPDYIPFIDNAKDAESRKKLHTAFNNRAVAANFSVLEEALITRGKIADVLGYPTFAHYVLDDRMAKDPKNVNHFLKRLYTKLSSKQKKEMENLLKLKKEENPTATELNPWDIGYYGNQLRKTAYNIDSEEIKKFFPIEHVTNGLFEVYQTLFGLNFREIKGFPAWHPEVKLFEASDQETHKPIGYFFMDMHPREGKYKHIAAMSTIIKGRELADGTYQKPVAAIIANFTKPSGATPSLLTHDEVTTYFHEFGHVVHEILTRAKYVEFSGTGGVAFDFAEAPSQMLENWVWQPEILEKLSGHYHDNSKKLPKAMIQKMIEAKNLTSGIIYSRQIFLAMLDQAYHTIKKPNTTQIYKELMKEITTMDMAEETVPQASFTHIMGEYDASYYGYLWSEVFSADMFSRFKKEGILNPEVGMAYRRIILEPGGSRDENELLREFLGRKPNEKAFLKSIGL